MNVCFLFITRNFEALFVLFGILLPTVSGVHLADGSWLDSFLICYALKHFVVSHLSGLLNSAAHVFGDQPYMARNKTTAGQNRILSWFSVGEGNNCRIKLPIN